MNVRAYSLVAKSTAASIERACQDVLSAWCSDWGVEPELCSIECVRAWERVVRDDAAWQSFGQSGSAATVWIGVCASAVGVLQSLMFPSDRRYSANHALNAESMATKAAVSALDVLKSRIAVSLAGTTEKASSNETGCPDGDLYKRASGALFVSIRIGDSMLGVLLNDACVRKNVPERTAAASADLRAIKRGSLLGNVPLAIPVELGRARIDAASLMTLAPGDVIRLDTAIEKPIPVLNAERQAMFAGYLGTSGESVVLEVARKG